MFFRIVLKALIHRRGRVGIALAALVVGAAVASATLSVYYDAGQKMSREMRAYGANVMLAPAESESFIAQTSFDAINQKSWPSEIVAASPVLYASVLARPVTPSGQSKSASDQRPAEPILAGVEFAAVRQVAPWWQVSGAWPEAQTECLVGSTLASQMGLAPGQSIEVSYSERKQVLVVTGIVTTQAAEDNQVLGWLAAARNLTGLRDQLSAVAISASGSTSSVESLANQMNAELPGVKARVVRQIAEGEGRVLSRLRLMMLSVTGIILIASMLSVGTTLTSLVIERRKEIGTMKAIGADERGLLRLFTFELACLGIIGGLIGYAIGIALAQSIGQSLFHSPVSPRAAVFGLVLGISLAVSLVSGAIPIRRIREVDPALILRGE